MTDIAKEASAYQIDLFQLFGEFWGRATGMPPEAFSTIDVRKCLKTAMANLHSSALEDIDKIAGEVCREIDAGIAGYNRSVREINDKFKVNTAHTAIGAVGGGLGLLIPTLAPFVAPVVPLVIAAKFTHDLLNRKIDLKKQSRSLMGVLAVAKLAN